MMFKRRKPVRLTIEDVPLERTQFLFDNRIASIELILKPRLGNMFYQVHCWKTGETRDFEHINGALLYFNRLQGDHAK
jgi:hypothetical protein